MNPIARSNQLVDYKIVRQLTPPPHTSAMYEYLFASNGVFIRGVRPGIEVIMPVQLYDTPIRGLSFLTPQFQIAPYPIPKAILLSMWLQSCLARNEEELIEILFHLQQNNGNWSLKIPSQTQQKRQCQTTESYHEALAEFHSHGSGSAAFSSTDNAEENGFRLYGIIGRLDTLNPEILVRVGLFGHFMIVPAAQVFDLPNFFIDVAWKHSAVRSQLLAYRQVT